MIKKKSIINIYLITMNVLLFLVVFGLIKIIHTTYTETLIIRLDPAQYNYYQKHNKQLNRMADINHRVVLFGDSRIQMWEKPPIIPGYDVINRGIGGQTTAQANLRIENDILNINADSVVIQLGINDLKTIAFIPAEYDKIVQTVKDNLESLITILVENDINVYVMTVIPASIPQGRWSFLWSKKIDSGVIEINEWIKSLEIESVIVLDPVALLSDGYQTYSRYSLDTLHLNDSGNEVLNSLLETIFD